MSAPHAGLRGSVWLLRLGHEINRHRHLVIHGNVDDLVRWNHRYDTFTESVFDVLRVLGFAAVARYSIAEGMTVPDEAHRRDIERLSRTDERSSAPDQPAPGPDETTHRRRGPMQAAQQQLDAQMRSGQRARPRNPAEALAGLVPLMTQTASPCAVLIDSPDLLIGPAGQVTDQFPAQVAYVRHLIQAAATPPPGRLRNTLIFVVRDLSSVPTWLQESPHVAVIPAELPRIDERRELLSQAVASYHRGDELTGERRAQAVSTLANLTDGMTILDIRSLTATSRIAGIEATDGRRLLARHRFALRDDPWEKLDVEKIRTSAERLRQRVVGQDFAVQEVSNVLANARVGIDFVAEGTDTGSRPKGVFFFVGPTGVGKTELAKAIAELVFDDETAMRRFDMSEFGQEHNSERLTGAPPGYVGHEQGGLLTNWIMERPFSVVLFDEIEKADPKIYDKFLQIIDDGRLTDGQGRTAYFSHSIVIFTSNIGAATMKELPDDPTYAVVSAHFQSKVREHFESINRPELLGRLGGGVVPFDVLRPAVIGQIVRKFLGQLTASALAKGFEVVIDEADVTREVEAALLGVGATYGSRQIRSPLLEQWVRVPLSRWILENSPAAGTRIRVYRTAGSPPFAVEALPTRSGSPNGHDLTTPGLDWNRGSGNDHVTERNQP